MIGLNRDSLIAILLLALCGILTWASFDIRNPDYGTLAPAAWPRAVLGVLGVFSVIYLVQSLRAGGGQRPASPAAGQGLGGFLQAYRNPIACYSIYFLFMVSLPYLGALIGGVLLVFALLTVLGGWKPRALVLHAVIAVVSMGFMWSLFTFGLRVLLPRGELLPGI